MSREDMGGAVQVMNVAEFLIALPRVAQAVAAQ